MVEGDILVSTNKQRAIVGVSYFLLASLAAKGVWMLPDLSVPSVVASLAAVFLGYEFADFGSGVYHWAMDNYGSKNTPIFGTQIEAFQGHHELPWTITYRQVCNNIYKICQATSPFCLADK
uniref:Lipid desaturase domain-containing protein n=1 Tax=Hanusia phi TaxID=3032 RepID=A0A7S0HD18_9CRYP